MVKDNNLIKQNHSIPRSILDDVRLENLHLLDDSKPPNMLSMAVTFFFLACLEHILKISVSTFSERKISQRLNDAEQE